jgi:putative hemolysin
VGDINDESDEEDLGFIKQEDGSFDFEGKVPLNDVCRTVGVANDFFDKVKGGSESLGGVMIELFGRLPHAGEEMEFEQFKFKVLSVDTRRIKKIKVSLKPNDLDEVSKELS